MVKFWAHNGLGGGIIIAAEEKSLEETQRHGVVATGTKSGNSVEVKGLVEKPKRTDAPSHQCIIGRYILQPQIFGRLDPKEKGTGSEIRLTDATAKLIGRTPFML
jgi:UTP--glucose-1-phosphate uridylyltransferase